MKGNKIDDLFRKGLASHKISAPSNAWEKIETQLPSQSKKGIYFWLSIAASLVLVLTFGWIMINSSSSEDVINKNLSAENSIIEKDDNNAVQKSPQAPVLEMATPAELDTKALVAEVTPDKNKQDQKAIIANPIDDASRTPQIINLKAKVETVNLEVVPTEFKEIELIKIDRRFAPKFQIVESIAQNNFMIDMSIDVEAYINSHQAISELPNKRKRFSLLSGIANVARGVNNGKIALSEIRKSKNEFVNNDLKYGSKEGEDEDLDEDLDKQEDNLNKR